ncbi:hypothetical protein Hanom_Chr08g00709961 [Helianthus anomalus]
MTSPIDDHSVQIPFFIVNSILQLQLHVIFATQFFYRQYVCSLRSRVLPRRRICDFRRRHCEKCMGVVRWWG